MNRTPWTNDFTCSVHNRPGDHPEEAACAAHLFVPAGTPALRSASSSPVMPYGPGATKPGPFTAKAGLAAAKYRKRPDPPEVTAVASGELMIVSTGEAPDYPMPRDLFFALYEAAEPEELPETEGALANAPALPHDVAKTALLEPGQAGNTQAEPAKPPAAVDDVDDDEETEQ